MLEYITDIHSDGIINTHSGRGKYQKGWKFMKRRRILQSWEDLPKKEHFSRDSNDDLEGARQAEGKSIPCGGSTVGSVVLEKIQFEKITQAHIESMIIWT